MIWAYLAHLSFNMWEEAEVIAGPQDTERTRWILNLRAARPELRFDEVLWTEILERLCAVGANMVVLDLGDGVLYDSHPEIAVKGAWTPTRVRAEVARLRGMGLEPIPKLNFSTTHDVWLGPYARCVSTPAYYDVCRDLIAETISLFDHPRFFHLGMDEETAEHQRNYLFAAMRQHDLWWHDLQFLVKHVEAGGARAWVWSDYAWKHPDYYTRMSPAVLQSNWYYGNEFDGDSHYINTYRDLDTHGFDQVPTGSNWSHPDNMEGTVAFCARTVAPERLFGFMQTPWLPTIPEYREKLLEAADRLGAAREIGEG